MARSKRFLSAVLLTYTYQGLLMLVGLWLTPFLLKQIGQHDYGVWLIGLQVLAYLSLVDIGVVALLPRELAYATGRAGGSTNSPELPFIFGRTLRIVACQMPLVILAAAVLWYLFPVPAQFRGFIGLILAAFTLFFPLRIFRATIEGLQDLKYMGSVTIVAWATGTALMIGLIFAGIGLYALAIGWAATQLLGAMAFAFRIWRRFPQVLPANRSHFSSTGSVEYFKRGFWASISQIATPLIFGSDILIIGKVLGAAAVVPYTCTAKLISILFNQPQALLDAAMPGLSEVKAGESKEHIFRVTTALTQASLMIAGAVVCAVVVVNRGFVSWWVGPRLYSGLTLTTLIALVMLLRQWNLTLVYSMFCYGLEKRLSLMSLLDGVTTAGVAVGLIYWLGPIGAPIASVVSVCVVCLPANLAAVAAQAGSSIPGLLRPLWPWFWRLTALAAAACLLARQWAPHGFFQTAATAALAALAYLGVMLSIGRKSVLWPYIGPRVLPIRDLLIARLGMAKTEVAG